jgi:hypothetical protein
VLNSRNLESWEGKKEKKIRKKGEKEKKTLGRITKREK